MSLLRTLVLSSYLGRISQLILPVSEGTNDSPLGKSGDRSQLLLASSQLNCFQPETVSIIAHSPGLNLLSGAGDAVYLCDNVTIQPVDLKGQTTASDWVQLSTSLIRDPTYHVTYLKLFLSSFVTFCLGCSLLFPHSSQTPYCISPLSSHLFTTVVEQLLRHSLLWSNG
jgi:hypothetical protein